MRICIGGSEFGEVYHAAAFVALAPDGLVSIVGEAPKWQLTCDFLNAISPGSAELCACKPGDAENVGRTADFFHERTSSNLPHEVSARILPLLEEVSNAVVKRASSVLSVVKGRTCFLWVRQVNRRPERNLTQAAFLQLRNVLVELGLTPILVGSRAPFAAPSPENLIEFYIEKPFQNNPLLELQLLNYLCENSDIRFSIGMKSGSMDGLAFARKLPTFYASHAAHNGRMDKVSAVFPALSLVRLHYNNRFAVFSPAELDDIRSRVSNICAST